MNELSLAKNLLVDQRGHWKDELVQASLYRGTRMPLSAICSSLRIGYSWRRVMPDKFVNQNVLALHLEATYDLHPAGKEIYQIQKEHFNLERSRFGTLSCWLLRANERVRQEGRVQYWRMLEKKGELPLTELCEQFRDWWLSERLDQWEKMIHSLKEQIDSNISEGPEFVFDVFNSYKSAQGKGVSSYLRGVSWNQITQKQAFEGAKAVSLCLSNILKEGVWSLKGPNPKNFLPALRNRPLDSIWSGGVQWRGISPTQSHAIGDMWRSRGALGIVPLSHVWAYAYNAKDEIVKHFIDELKGHHRVYTPMDDPKFYYHYAHKDRPGWYMFGDNIALMDDEGNVQIRDVAMSEVLQAMFRQGKNGENLVWFPWLNADTRQGPSGDPFTTMWNLEGNIGLLTIQEDEPGMFLDAALGLTDIIEETTAFLGMGWTSDGRLLNLGMKLTVDSADKRIPVYLRPKGHNFLRWSESKVDLERALQTVVAYGLHEDIDLVWWYDRTVDSRSYDIEMDYLSADERVMYGLENQAGIIDDLMDIIKSERMRQWWPKLSIELLEREHRRQEIERTDEPTGSSEGIDSSLDESRDEGTNQRELVKDMARELSEG